MIPELIYLIFIAAGALALGSFAKQKFHKSESKLEEFVVGSGLGFTILSVAMLALGLLRLYRTPVFAAVTVLLLLLIALQAKKIFSLCRPDLKWLGRSSWVTKMLFLAFAGFAILNLIASAAPPTSADALLHHLTAPRIYLQEGGIINLPSLQLMTEAPMSVNMDYLYALWLRNGQLAQMMAWYLGFLASLTVFLIAARMSNKQSAIAAAALFSTLPIFSVFSVRAYVDVPLAFFALLALYFFLKCSQNSGAINAAFTGIFLGMAVSAKNTGILTGAAFAAVTALIFLRVPGRDKGKIIKSSIIAAVIICALLAPWLIKSYANTGDPLHPFLFKQLGGTYWNSELEKGLLEFHRSHGIGFEPWKLPLFPLELTLHPQKFADTAGITPLFLGFLPLLWLLRKRITRQVGILLLFAAVLLVLQFFTAQQTRYMFLLWGIMGVVVAYIVNSFAAEKKLYLALNLLVLAAVAINAPLWAAANLDDVPVSLGLQSQHDYLMKKVPSYGATEYLATADKDATFCWYGEGRGYWSKNKYVWCNPLYQGYIDFYSITTPQQLDARLKELGVSYVLYEKDMAKAPLYGKQKIFSDKTTEHYFAVNKLMLSYLAAHGEKAYSDDNAELYRIKGQ